MRLLRRELLFSSECTDHERAEESQRRVEIPSENYWSLVTSRRTLCGIDCRYFGDIRFLFAFHGPRCSGGWRSGFLPRQRD
jgi:hypothetical protein